MLCEPPANRAQIYPNSSKKRGRVVAAALGAGIAFTIGCLASMNIDLLYRLGQTEDRLEEEAARNRALERRGRLLTCQNDRHQILARMIEDYGMEYVQEQIVENPNLSPECCKDPRRLHKPSYCVPPPGVILPQPDWSDGTSSDQEKFWPVPI